MTSAAEPPRYVAIITDGNGRWARQRPLPVIDGHKGGAAVAKARRRRGGEGFRSLPWAPEMHDPDVIIRPSGEQRMSNYLLWQSAYSELVFADELWPDFSREAFRAALDVYEGRRRRFGGR